MSLSSFFYAACLGCAVGSAYGAEGFSSRNGAAGGVSSLSGLWAQSYGARPGKVHLYRNDTNPWLQEFNVSLRAQYQAAAVSPNGSGMYPGSHGRTEEWRRLRLGWNARMFRDLKVTNIWNMGGVDGLGYEKEGRWHGHRMTRGNLYEANLEYSLPDATVGVGKVLPVILAENRISSSKYKLPEISAVENMLVSDSSFGVWSYNDEKKEPLGYYAGLWSNTDERSRGTWGTWESVNMSLGLSARADGMLLKEGRLYCDWIYNWGDMKDRPYDGNYTGTGARNVLALYYYGKQGAFELMAQAVWASRLREYSSGGGVIAPSGLAGLTVMPSFNLTGHVQAVARYQLAFGPDAVKLNKRYASLAERGGNRVDCYQAVAAGLNFFVYRDDPARLKIMTMAEYGHSRGGRSAGFTGWTFICGAYTNF